MYVHMHVYIVYVCIRTYVCVHCNCVCSSLCMCVGRGHCAHGHIPSRVQTEGSSVSSGGMPQRGFKGVEKPR